MIETHTTNPSTQELSNKAMLHELIAHRAYQRYAARGYLDGFDLHDWVQAEQEILKELDLQFETVLTAAG